MIEPSAGDESCNLELTIEDNTGLSNTTQIDVQVYSTYLMSDVQPQPSEEAGEFGDGLINAPDVVYMLQVSTGVIEAPSAGSDLFDAMDPIPLDIDVNVDGDVFDEEER